MDLREVDLERTLALRGEWLAAEGPDDLRRAWYGYDDSAWRPVHVEGYFVDQGFPDEGLVWYRLHVRLPATTFPLKGFLQHADNAHAIYVARPERPPELVASSGVPGASADRTVRSRAPVVFDLPSDPSFVITWKVANFDYANGGPFYAMQIGSADSIDRMLLWKTARVFSVFGAYLIIGLAFLTYWWTHRRDTQTLAIGLLGLAMAIRTLTVAGMFEYLVPGSIEFWARILLESTTFLIAPGLMAFFLWSFFPQEMSPVRLGRFRLTRAAGLALLELESDRTPRPPLTRRWRVFNTGVLATAVVSSILFTLAAAVISPEVASHVMRIARWTYLVLAPLGLIVVAQAVYLRRPLSTGVAVGFSVLLLAGVHDILLASGYFMGSTYLATYAFLAFLAIQGYVMTSRYATFARIAHESSTILKEQIALRTKELRAATIAAHAANMAKSQFLSAVSHELRSPLAAILGYTKILDEELGENLEPQHREFFETIRASGERLVVLVNDILDIAKVEAGKLDLTFTAVDLHQMGDEILEQLSPLVRGSDVELRTEFPPEPRYVRADPIRIRQVMLNLVSNALKFTREGQVVLTTHERELDGRPAYAVAVSDTGPGISPDFLPHLFDRFTQEQRLYTETQRGTGLGLSISRELVVRMNGVIEVESTLGSGSVFAVVLPRADKASSLSSVAGDIAPWELAEASRMEDGEPRPMKSGADAA